MRKSLIFYCFICALFGALGMILTMSILVTPAQAQEEERADITFEGEMIRLQDYVFPGNTGAYRVKVKNIGTEPTGDFKVVMSFNYADVCFHTVDLDPGEVKNLWCGFAGSLVGDLHAEARADTTLSVRELDEDNNYLYHRFQISLAENRTDIAVDGPIRTQVPELHTGDDIDFSVVIKNTHNVPTGRFASNWYIEGEKDPVCSAGLQLQPLQEMLVACVIRDLPYDGSLNMRYVADKWDYVIERDEDNNEVAAQFDILPKRDVPIEYIEKPAEEPEDITEEEPVDSGQVLGEADVNIDVPSEPVTFESLAGSLLEGIATPRDNSLETRVRDIHLEKLAIGVNPVSEPAFNAIMDFIAYGIDANSMKLGEGERAAVIYSYKYAFNRLPSTEAQLADVIRIANGRWPVEQNLEAQDASHKIFYKIYGHVADMSNPHENAAITIMTYGLKQQAQNRNLESEKAGIKTFRHIFGHGPSTTQDWNVMQAITYSGASR